MKEKQKTYEYISAGCIEDLKSLKGDIINEAEQNETLPEEIFETRIDQIQECIDIVTLHLVTTHPQETGRSLEDFVSLWPVYTASGFTGKKMFYQDEVVKMIELYAQSQQQTQWISVDDGQPTANTMDKC